MQGTILTNRYLIAEEIGFGGMGSVYRAIDLHTGGEVAVKVPHAFLARNPDFVERLRREAQIGASLYSSRIVRVIDLDTHEGVPYLVMEYVPGETLADLLQQRGRLTVEESLTIGLEIARALEAAHAKGVVHRDLKPQNIKLVDGAVKVLDFGIARAQGFAVITAASEFMGTPEYTAPERVEGEGDIRADIYSLGVLLYQMLMGALPFTARSPIALIEQHMTEAVPALTPNLPARVTAIVGRCLEKSPGDRYQTPHDLVHDLRVQLEASTSGELPTIKMDRRAHALEQSGSTGDEPRAVIAAPPPSGEVQTPAHTAPATPLRAAPVRRGRRLAMAFVALATIVVVVAGAVIVARILVDRGGDAEIASNPPTDGATTTPRGRSPAPSPTRPLLAVGEQRSLADLPPITLPPDDPTECPGVQSIWRLISISAEASGRVTVAYTVQVPRVADVEECRATLPPTTTCRCWALQTRLASERVKEVVLSSGGGVTDTGADDIYGRDPLSGTWIFDSVDLAGTELTLLFYGVDNSTVPLRRQLLLKG